MISHIARLEMAAKERVEVLERDLVRVKEETAKKVKHAKEKEKSAQEELGVLKDKVRSLVVVLEGVVADAKAVADTK